MYEETKNDSIHSSLFFAFMLETEVCISLSEKSVVTAYIYCSISFYTTDVGGLYYATE